MKQGRTYRSTASTEYGSTTTLNCSKYISYKLCLSSRQISNTKSYQKQSLTAMALHVLPKDIL